MPRVSHYALHLSSCHHTLSCCGHCKHFLLRQPAPMRLFIIIIIIIIAFSIVLTRPCLNLKYNVVPTSRCKVAAHTSRPRTQPHSCCWVPLLSSSHQTYDCIPCNHSRATRFLPIYRRSFHPLWHPASAQSLSQFDPPTSNRKFISAND